jgi:hypothetical protein
MSIEMSLARFSRVVPIPLKDLTSLDILRVPCYMVEYKNPGLWLVGVFLYSWEWPPSVAPQVKQ